MPVPYHEPFFAHTSPSPTTNKWAPYSNARDFTTNMVITLGVLLCGLLLALALNIAVRFLLCRRRRRSPPLTPSAAGDLEKQQAVAVGPTLVFVAKESESAECAICLAEFAEGERVRVLPACNHGFHVSCVDRWLDSQRSCPTCRASCVQPLGKDESNSNGSQVCISL